MTQINYCPYCGSDKLTMVAEGSSDVPNWVREPSERSYHQCRTCKKTFRIHMGGEYEP